TLSVSTQIYTLSYTTLFRAAQHPLHAKIIEYREIAKLKSTYVDALPKLIRRDTGRLHTSFSQTGTATGRLSSSDPNLQNIPIRTELGREIRAAFVAEPGKIMLAADYSQVELRIMAHFSKDAVLVDAFRSGQDIHARTAQEVFGVGPMAEINSTQVQLRNFAERTALNSPLQGTAADLIKMAMIGIARRLKEEKLKAQMILQVHDELVFEAPPEEKEALEKLVREEME